VKKRVSRPRSRADWLMPYAERYISLVIERRWRGQRLHPRDLSKLDADIETALVDYEAAWAREARIEAQAAEEPVAKKRRTRVLLRPLPEPAGRQRPDPKHPWNQRAVMPKKA